MKTSAYSVIALLIALAGDVAAVGMETAAPQHNAPRFSMYNDGHNTYIQSVPGLIIQGATADGDKLIIPGVQREVRGFLSGKPVVISQHQEPPQPSAALLNERLKRIEEDLKKKEKALADAAKPVAPVKPVPPPAPEPVWEIRKSDGTLFNALSRWAGSANPKRQIVFATEGNDFPADTEASVTGDFDKAIEDVMKSLQNSKYPVRACFWDNKPRPVVKIIHKTKRCED
jgi:hypothetical protein